QLAVTAGREGPVADHRRRAHHRATRHLEFPLRFTLLGVTVERLVASAEEDIVAAEAGAGGDLGPRINGPTLLPGGGFEAMEDAVCVTDIDCAVADRRTGFNGTYLIAFFFIGLV